MQKHNSPREGGKSRGENFNQSDSSNVNLFATSPHLTSSPREGAVTKSNQSEAMELYSAKNIQKSLSPILNLNHTSSNKSIINSSKHNFQRKMSKFILPSIKQMENSIEERNRAETRQTVEMITESRKRKRMNTANKNKTNYSRMLANFRTNRMKRTVRVNMIADKVEKKKEQEAPVNTHKKSFTAGLHNILDADLLGELTIEDSQLIQLRKHILAKDREGFLRLGSYMANFWDDASVINDCIIIDNRVAIPTCLRKAEMARLHRTHPGQEAMVDAAQYLWWPKMHREIIDLC